MEAVLHDDQLSLDKDDAKTQTFCSECLRERIA
jgi:hypothetical protein